MDDRHYQYSVEVVHPAHGTFFTTVVTYDTTQASMLALYKLGMGKSNATTTIISKRPHTLR